MKLSLVVAAKGACDAGPFMAALQEQGAIADPEIEVLIIQDAESRWIGAKPGLVAPRLSTVVSVFHLWGFGASVASGEYLAILDIHCPPAPGWLAAVKDRLSQGAAAFYGPVEPAYRTSDARIIGYLTEYVQFHRPVAPGMGEIAGNNLVLRRDLAGDPAHLRSEGFVKTLILQDLKSACGGVERLNTAVVLHNKPFELSAYILRRFRHGRCYAAQRREQPGAAPGWALALLTPLLPLVRVWRIHGHAARIPGCHRAFWRYAPHILAAETGWSIGEFKGYLAGEGNSRARLD